MSQQRLIAELVAALGLPKRTVRAVLTLDVNKIPTLDITTYVTVDDDGYAFEPDPNRPPGSLAERLATVRQKFTLIPVEE